jgi:LuxR family transcriptional regulator, maltose regulon positive regulatory protein
VLQQIDEYSPYNAPVAYLGLARIHYQWNDLDAAERNAEKSLQLAQQYDQVIDRLIISEIFLARLKLARGDATAAMSKIKQAEQISRLKNNTFRLPDIAFYKAKIHLFQGNVNEAAQMVQQYEIPLMQARVLIAQSKPFEALPLVEPQRQWAEEKGLANRLLLVMAVQSIVLFAQGQKDQALQVLSEALAMAEPGGHIRLFVDEGDLMEQLLREAASRGIRPDYIARLLAAFEGEPKEEQQAASVPVPSSLIEPLSPRELEILKLIAQGLSNREIGERLFLALDTIKGHNRKIFDKLEVQSRTEAIASARVLGLL